MTIDYAVKKTHRIFDSVVVQTYINLEARNGLTTWDFGYLLLKNPPKNENKRALWKKYLGNLTPADIRNEVGIKEPINSRATLHHELKTLIDKFFLYKDPKTSEIQRELRHYYPDDIIKAAIRRLETLQLEPACSTGLISFFGVDSNLLSFARENEVYNNRLENLTEQLYAAYADITNMWLTIKLDEILGTLTHYLHSTSFTLKRKAAIYVKTNEMVEERINILTGGFLGKKDTYLFTLKKVNKRYLKKGLIHKKIREAFEEHRMPLPNMAVIYPMKEGFWKIEDDSKIYRIEVTQKKIDVYQSLNKLQSVEKAAFDLHLKELKNPSLNEQIASMKLIRNEIPKCKRVLNGKQFNEWFYKDSGLLIPLDKPVVVFGDIFGHGLDEIPKEDWQ